MQNLQIYKFTKSKTHIALNSSVEHTNLTKQIPYLSILIFVSNYSSHRSPTPIFQAGVWALLPSTYIYLFLPYLHTIPPQLRYRLHTANCSMPPISTLHPASSCIVSPVSAKEAMSEALSCRQPGGCQVSWLETLRPPYFTIIGI